MLNRSQFGLFLALVGAASMWLYVYSILIPHQEADAFAKQIPRGYLSDLYPRWLGARELLLRGRNPYSADITREIQNGYYGRPIDESRPNDPKDPQAFAYPLYVVFLLAPTVGLPFPIVQQGFFWLLVIVTAASVPLWLGALGWRVSTTTELLWIVLAVGCFPAIQGFKLQQLTLLVAALLAAAMYATARRHFVWGGVLLALASIKPQLMALVIVWLGIWAAGNWRERQRLMWAFGLSMIALVAGAEFLLPGWMAEFRAASAAYYVYTGGGKSVLDVELTPLWGRIVAAILVCVMLGLTSQCRRDNERSAAFHWSLAVVMATTLAVIPMFAPYNQLLLIPALMAIARAIRPLWMKDWLSRFLAVVTGLSVFWPWLAATALVFALLFLPAPVVQRAWSLPLYTSLAIPLLVLAVLLAGRKSATGGKS